MPPPFSSFEAIIPSPCGEFVGTRPPASAYLLLAAEANEQASRARSQLAQQPGNEGLGQARRHTDDSEFRGISIFDIEFEGLISFDIKFAGLSKYDIGHANSFETGISRLFLDFVNFTNVFSFLSIPFSRGHPSLSPIPPLLSHAPVLAPPPERPPQEPRPLAGAPQELRRPAAAGAVAPAPPAAARAPPL